MMPASWLFGMDFLNSQEQASEGNVSRMIVFLHGYFTRAFCFLRSKPKFFCLNSMCKKMSIAFGDGSIQSGKKSGFRNVWARKSEFFQEFPDRRRRKRLEPVRFVSGGDF